FQAEDGIRDYKVTGVQTCALPIYFFFIPPFYSFAVLDFRHIVTFGVMLFVAVVISGLARRVHDHAEAARERERRTAFLYHLNREDRKSTRLNSSHLVISYAVFCLK